MGRDATSDAVVLGAGLVGLSTAMLLARDGFEVTVLERDPQPPPDTIDEIWTGWERKGVTQFHQGHYFQPRLTTELQRELPDLVGHLERCGALRYNPIAHAASLNGAVFGPEDTRFDTLTARRPVMEAALASAVAEADGVDVRRGVAIEGVVLGAECLPGVPHITGVRTEGGEEVIADLVVDATGRRSALPRWLDAVGAPQPLETSEDVGFTYFGRHFQGDAIPEMHTSLLSNYGSISLLTLPGDNNSWLVGFVGQAGDKPLRALLDVDTWHRTLGHFDNVAHWADGKPLDDRILTMANIEDRKRAYVVDGQPVVTGVLAVGDSWACSNPSLGRGATIGLLHAIALRDALREHPVDDPAALSVSFSALTAERVEPWYDATLDIDRGRKAEIDADRLGEPLEPAGPEGEITKAFQRAAIVNADSMRDFTQIAAMLKPVSEVISEPGVVDRAIEHGMDWREAPRGGPSRQELLALLDG